MATKIYRPNEVFHTTEPGIFLAGPIQGAPNWQQESETMLDRVSLKRGLDFNIYNPRADNFDPKDEAAQKHWEKTYLKRARDSGAILFWLAAQDFSIEDYPEGRSYAQTTRIELGRAFGWRDYNPRTRIVLGIDPNYEGGSDGYIVSCAEEYDLVVHQDLGRLCLHAADLINV